MYLHCRSQGDSYAAVKMTMEGKQVDIYFWAKQMKYVFS